MMDSDPGSPVLKDHRLAIKGEIDITPHVPVLLVVGSPFTISRLVALFIVDPLYRTISRFLPHIGEEVFKRFSPALANGNPTSSVVLKILVFGVAASLDNPDPAKMRWCFGKTVSGLPTAVPWQIDKILFRHAALRRLLFKGVEKFPLLAPCPILQEIG